MFASPLEKGKARPSTEGRILWPLVLRAPAFPEETGKLTVGDGHSNMR